ncbi:UNVERIFIED_CONTAM: MFS transporter [Halobacillus marinus]
MESAKSYEEKRGVSLWKSRSFLLLSFTTVVSSLSLSMFMFLQSWYIVESLHMAAALGMVLISLTTVRMVSMIVGGVVADRCSQTKVMAASDLTMAVFLFTLSICFLTLQEVPVWIMAVHAGLFGACGGMFEPARDALLPKVTGKDQLTRANSVIQGTIQIATFTGPLLAGVLIHSLSYSFVLLIIVLFLILSGVGILFVKKQGKDAQEGERSPFYAQLAEGFRYTWQSRLLRSLFIITIIVNFFISGPLMMGLPIFVEGVLDGSALDFSLVQGGLTFGMILGAVLIGFLNIRRRRGAYALYLIALEGAGMFIFSRADTLVLSVLIIVLIGMIIPAVNIPLLSLVQSSAEESKVGRVMSLIRTGSLGLIPLSYAVTSLFLGWGIPIQTLMAWSALPLLVSVFVLYVTYPVLRSAD